MSADFIPGEYWTPDRARAAAGRMAERMASPDMQAFMRQVAGAGAAGGDPAAAAAAMAPAEAAHLPASAPATAADCRYRRGRPSDIPDFARLIIAGDLPPLFIEEFAEGFVAVEHEAQIVGCGGLEIYDRCGVIRSVVVDERARGQRIGERIAALLMDEARHAGVTDVYLFTMHAYSFWRRQGFIDAPLDTWKEPPRVSWQYQFIAQYPEASVGVYPMWRSAPASSG